MNQNLFKEFHVKSDNILEIDKISENKKIDSTILESVNGIIDFDISTMMKLFLNIGSTFSFVDGLPKNQTSGFTQRMEKIKTKRMGTIG